MHNVVIQVSFLTACFMFLFHCKWALAKWAVKGSVKPLANFLRTVRHCLSTSTVTRSIGWTCEYECVCVGVNHVCLWWSSSCPPLSNYAWKKMSVYECMKVWTLITWPYKRPCGTINTCRPGCMKFIPITNNGQGTAHLKTAHIYIIKLSKI